MQAMQQIRVQTLRWEGPLEEEMATCSSILAWKIPWTEEPSRLQSMELQRVGHDWATEHIKWYTHVIIIYIIGIIISLLLTHFCSSPDSHL